MKQALRYTIKIEPISSFELIWKSCVHNTQRMFYISDLESQNKNDNINIMLCHQV